MDPFVLDPLSPEVDFSPAAVWACARQEYLAGEAAYRICERYEIPLSTFRERARREGWRRRDAEIEPVEPRELDPAPPTDAMIEQARRAMADALKRGRAYEARTFLRLMYDLREEARRERSLAFQAAQEATEAETDVAGLDSLDPESSSPIAAEAHSIAEAFQAGQDELEAERDRLQALARSGRATPADLLALRQARLQIASLASAQKAAARAVKALAEVDKRMGIETS